LTLLFLNIFDGRSKHFFYYLIYFFLRFFKRIMKNKKIFFLLLKAFLLVLNLMSYTFFWHSFQLEWILKCSNVSNVFTDLQSKHCYYNFTWSKSHVWFLFELIFILDELRANFQSTVKMSRFFHVMFFNCKRCKTLLLTFD
jgi:hypothetical protein